MVWVIDLYGRASIQHFSFFCFVFSLGWYTEHAHSGTHKLEVICDAFVMCSSGFFFGWFGNFVKRYPGPRHTLISSHLLWCVRMKMLRMEGEWHETTEMNRKKRTIAAGHCEHTGTGMSIWLSCANASPKYQGICICPFSAFVLCIFSIN